MNLCNYYKNCFSEFDPEIANVEIKYGPERIGDVRHSLASIVKSTTLLGYKPEQDLRTGLEKAIAWYWGRTFINTLAANKNHLRLPSI